MDAKENYLKLGFYLSLQAIELGDALEVKYTGWLWTNNGFGKVSQTLSLKKQIEMFHLVL